MSAPKRIQQRRTKGWRKPEGAVAVGRGTRWGNPFRIGDSARVWHLGGQEDELYLDRFTVLAPWHAVALFRHAMEGDPNWYPDGWQPGIVPDLTALRGKDLMCWCPLPEPGQPDHCHAAALIELANTPEGPPS